MEPKIVSLGEFKLVGMQYVGNNQNGEIPQMWGAFMHRSNEIKNIANSSVAYGYAECRCEGECKCGQGGDFLYIAALEVSNFDEIPEGMVTRTVPPSKYAVFTHKGSIETLGITFNNIFSKWLPAAGLAPNQKFGFEYFDKRFNYSSEDSELDIYVPVS